MFNSLRYAQKLEAVGLTREQAETHVLMLTELMQSDLATKKNLDDLGLALKSDITELRTELKSDVDNLRSELREFKTEVNARFIISEQRMTIRLGTIVTVAIGTAVALTKLIA